MGDTNDRSANFDTSGYRCTGLQTRLLEIVGLGHCGWALVVVPRGNTLGLVSDLDSQSIVI
jgi:hypothetical protein